MVSFYLGLGFSLWYLNQTSLLQRVLGRQETANLALQDRTCSYLVPYEETCTLTTFVKQKLSLWVKKIRISCKWKWKGRGRSEIRKQALTFSGRERNPNEQEHHGIYGNIQKIWNLLHEQISWRLSRPQTAWWNSAGWQGRIQDFF